jgi:glycine cleavage system pyridoxal-binding protein P
VKLDWADITIAAACTAAACAAIYVGLMRASRRAVAERQQATERKLIVLEAAVKALQLRVAEMDAFSATRTERGEVDAMAGVSENIADMTGEVNKEMKHEMLAAITAAAATFLGRAARVRSVQALSAPAEVGAWAQQGRVFVQTSHNLRSRS